MNSKNTSTFPWVISPEVSNVPLEGWRTERPVISYDKCRQCGVCYIYCPTGCIEEKQDCFEINLKFCKGCGICSLECGNQAITMVEEK